MNRKMKNTAVCIMFALLLSGGFILCSFMPKSRYSESERRSLAVMPKLSAVSLWNGHFMADFETYAVDAFPFRDAFRRIKACTAERFFLKQDNNGIYVADGFISALEYPVNEASMDRAAERFRYICEKYLTDENRVFFSIIPDKNCFLAEKSGRLSIDYEEFEKRMAARVDFAEYIRISDLLERDDYYRTDTHWRQEKIVDVADRLAGAMDTALVEDDYIVNKLERDFYGVYYGQAALPAAPDTLEYLTGEIINGCRVYDWQNRREIPVYNMTAAMGRDPYEMFLGGSLSLLTIENPNAQGDRNLIIFRDSFGSSIAPLLASGYSKIVLVDIRYIHPDLLEQFVDFEGCDILFLYSTLVLNHSDTIK